MERRNRVEFYWTFNDKDHLILLTEIDWKFQEGEIIHFWEGKSAVIKTETALITVQDQTLGFSREHLEVIQRVWVDPIGWSPRKLNWEYKPVVYF